MYGRKTSVSDPFQNWYIGTYKNMAANKVYDLDGSRFEILVLSQFASDLESLKTIAWAMRDAPFSKDVFLCGIPQGKPSVLYDKILKAFDEALVRL